MKALRDSTASRAKVGLLTSSHRISGGSKRLSRVRVAARNPSIPRANRPPRARASRSTGGSPRREKYLGEARVITLAGTALGQLAGEAGIAAPSSSAMRPRACRASRSAAAPRSADCGFPRWRESRNRWSGLPPPVRMTATLRADVVIVGSGLGGSAIVKSLAGTGLSVLVLERGDFVRQEAQNWDVGEVAVRHRYDAGETWFDAEGRPFVPRAYYNVGGATKFFGGSALRFRPADFAARELEGGATAAWPYDYSELEPWYAKAEALLEVHGQAGEDPTEGPRGAYPRPPLEHEPVIAGIAGRLAAQGLHPFHLPVAVDQGPKGRCVKGSPCDGFPCKVRAKGDAENRILRPLLLKKEPWLELRTACLVERLETDPSGDARCRGPGPPGRRALPGRRGDVRGRCRCRQLRRPPPPLGKRPMAGGPRQFERTRRDVTSWHTTTRSSWPFPPSAAIRLFSRRPWPSTTTTRAKVRPAGPSARCSAAARSSPRCSADARILFFAGSRPLSRSGASTSG